MTKILIIEDHEIVSEGLTDMLSFEGYYVQEAIDGETGIQAAKEWKPDLILCDVLMPGIDGYEVLKRLQDDEETQLIPFIFLSALVSPEQIRRGLDLGASDYLLKPCKRKVLLSAIKKRLQQRDLTHQKIASKEADVMDSLFEELPKKFGCSLRKIVSTMHVIDDLNKENQRIVQAITSQLKELIELVVVSSAEKEFLRKTVLELESIDKNCKQSNENYQEGLLVSTDFYTSILSLFNSVERL